ncbi:hypothetical protein ACFFX0_33110 [Citricoccus parietis]|uniref:Uncharacterized protein n=1 Tax=Citricoccus parietis TaxID=592307 RepID=A0ABV5G0N6_9MICC
MAAGRPGRADLGLGGQVLGHDMGGHGHLLMWSRQPLLASPPPSQSEQKVNGV